MCPLDTCEYVRSITVHLVIGKMIYHLREMKDQQKYHEDYRRQGMYVGILS